MCSKPNKKRKTRHYFFLNPYDNEGFTRCPICAEKTKFRKFPLLIHIEPAQLLVLNKKCKYCVKCDLIISKQSELEHLMVIACEKNELQIIGNDYVVVGTAEKADWREFSKTKPSNDEVLDKVYIFKDVKNFELSPGGWEKE